MEENPSQIPQEAMVVNKQLWIIFGVLLVVLVGVGIVAFVFLRHKQPNSYSSNMQNSYGNNFHFNSQVQVTDNFARQYAQGCTGSGTKTFGSSPMNISDIRAVIPMGLMVDAHVTPIDHMYVSPKDFHGPRDEYPVFAIADGDIVDIQHRTNFVGTANFSPGGKTDEYRVVVQYSCTFFSYYDLITSLSPSILSQAGNLGDRKNRTVTLRIPIKQGEEIGRIGGQTLDFAVWNTEVSLPGLLVPAHYAGEGWKIHTDNPFTYFQEPIRSQLLALDQRTAKPRQGKIDYDLDGKLVGNWFIQGTGGYDYERTNPQSFWTNQLSIVYDYLDPTQIRISMGKYNEKPAQFGVLGNAPDPATITPNSGVIKYQLVQYDYTDQNGNPWDRFSPIKNIQAKNHTQVQGTVLVQMTGERQIKFEVFPGKTANQINGFDANAIIYER